MPPKRRASAAAAAAAAARNNSGGARRRQARPVVESEEDSDDYSYDGYSEEVAEDDDDDDDGAGGYGYDDDDDDDDEFEMSDGSPSSGNSAAAGGRRRRGAASAGTEQDHQGNADVDIHSKLRPMSPITVECQVPGGASNSAAEPPHTVPGNAEYVITGVVLVLEPRLGDDDDDGAAPLPAEVAVSALAYESVAVGPIPLLHPSDTADATTTKRRAAKRGGGGAAASGGAVTCTRPSKQHRSEVRIIAAGESKPSPSDLAWTCGVAIAFAPPRNGVAAEKGHPAFAASEPAQITMRIAELSPSRPQLRCNVTLPPGATFRPRAVISLLPDGAWSDDVRATVVLTGNLVPRAPGVHLVIEQRWFQVRPGQRRAPVTTADGRTHYLPEGSVCQVSRLEGSVMFLADKRDVSKHSSDLTPAERALEKSKMRAIADAEDWAPFKRYYTPARPQEAPVRIRRFPHRAADVVGECAPNVARPAIGIVQDPKTRDRYVVWASEPFGYSRLDGTRGPFLLETSPSEAPATRVEVFQPLQWYSAAASTVAQSDGTTSRGVPIYSGPRSGDAAVTSFVEHNETKLAAGLFVTTEGITHVCWAEGGYSPLLDPHTGSAFLAPLNSDQRDGPFRARVRRSRLPATDAATALDEVVDLDALRQQQRQQRRGDDGLSAVPPVTYETRPTLSPRSEALRRYVDDLVDGADADPELYELREQLGTLTLARYPRISLGGVGDDSDGGEGDSYDEASSGFDDSDG